MVSTRNLMALSGFCLAFCVFNIHRPDLGESYVARNLSAWLAVGLCLPIIWREAKTVSRAALPSYMVYGLVGPVGGILFVIAVNIFGGGTSWQLDHLFFPFMLLGFALLTLGLIKRRWVDRDKALLLLIALFAFLPQYAIHFIERQFSDTFIQQSSFLLALYKPYAGFSQYNLMGSFLSALLVFTGYAVSQLKMPKGWLWAFYGLAFVYALEVPIMNSKAGFLGLFGGIALLGLHLYFTDTTGIEKKRYWAFVLLIPIAYLFLQIFYFLPTEPARSAADWRLESNSINSRLTMWIIAWRSFLEAPLFGHGLGSYVETYYTHFARYGLAEELSFYPNTKIPHNLTLHLLSETGLIGTLLILGPLVYMAFRIIWLSDNRWLIMALAFPILLHTQTEFPYVSSGLHYILLAAAIALGLGHVAKANGRPRVVAKNGQSRMAYAGICAMAAVLVFGTAYISQAYTKASKRFYLSRALPFEDYLAYSYSSEAPFHPLFERRLRAITDLRAINIAIKEERRDFLATLGVKFLEANILPYYETPAIWSSAAQVYALLGQYDKLSVLILRVDKFDPKLAAQLRAPLRDD